jgi:hypothetical protein
MTNTTTLTLDGTTATILIHGDLEHVKNFDALTPAGAGISATEDDTSPEATSYRSGAERRHTPRWEALYTALRERDANAIVAAAKRLPSVRIGLNTRHARNPNFGFTVGLGGWLLFVAPVL